MNHATNIGSIFVTITGLILASACGGGGGSSSGSTTGGGGGSSSSGGSTTGTATSTGSGMTDEQVCDHACSTLILQCSVDYDSSCAAGCLKAPTFLSCAKTANDDCNALAACSFAQGCGALAPSGA